MFTKWDHRFMEMAQLVSTWASCYQEERKVGAVIVKDKRHEKSLDLCGFERL